MAVSNNILSFRTGERRATLNEQAQSVVSDCRHVAERALPKLMGGLFEKLDDALYELADKSDSSQLQTAYFDAMRTLRKHQTRIQSSFSGGVLREFDQFWQRGPRSLAPEQPNQQGYDDGLELIDEDVLEQSLAVNNLISKGENRYQRELYALNKRFGYLMDGFKVEMDSNPLGPASICGSFHHAVKSIAVDTPVRLVIYKLFDKQVMHYVGGMYEEINALLSRAGISPKQGAAQRNDSARRHLGARPSRNTPPQAPFASGSAGAAPPYGAGQMPSPEQGSMPGAPQPHGMPAGGPEGQSYAGAAQYGPGNGQLQAELFQTLQQLLLRYRGAEDHPASVPAQNLPTVATPELIGALSDLQHASMRRIHHGDDTSSSPLDLRDRLSDQLSLANQGKASRILDKVDEDTLDVISMLFDFLLEDPNLPDAMKALMARLQIPMLKTAIMDKSFFSQNLHPARRLLNSLARAAVGWSDDGDRSENSLFGRIEFIINRVVAGFEDDPTVFDALNEEFAAFVDREQRGAVIAEERTNQVTRGKEQLRAAKALVGGEIERRLQAYANRPRVVIELLDEGWKDVLLLTYLRQGPESASWRKNLELTDRLLWSVEPKHEYPQRQELLRAIPDLLRSLREGLNGISYDQHKMARMFKELQACHIACLRGGEVPKTAKAPVGKPPVDRPSSSPPGQFAEPANKDEVIKQPEETGAESLEYDHFTSMAEDLSVGTWLELQEEDGRRVRIKLSWKSDVSDAYVFVNRKGVKVLEMTMAGVAKLFRRGAAEVLMDVEVPIMDRALSAMMQTLKNKPADGD